MKSDCLIVFRGFWGSFWNEIQSDIRLTEHLAVMDRKNEMSTVEEEDSDSSVLSEPESVKHSIKVSTINLDWHSGTKKSNFNHYRNCLVFRVIHLTEYKLYC